ARDRHLRARLSVSTRRSSDLPGDGGIVPDGSIVRNVAAKRAVTLGGLSAVLLQLARPMVAQGVSHYSAFDRDPLGRMISTLDATARQSTPLHSHDRPNTDHTS